MTIVFALLTAHVRRCHDSRTNRSGNHGGSGYEKIDSPLATLRTFLSPAIAATDKPE